MSKTLKILSRPKGNAEEYGRWAVNPYLGCSNNCNYCFLKKGPGAKTLGGDAPVLKKGVVNEEHAYHLAMAEIIEHREEIIKDGGLFMTFTSDPCAAETRSLFFRIVKGAMGKRIPVMLLTKNADFTKEYCYENIRWRLSVNNYGHDVAFGWTLTGHDELEPHAPSNEMRLQEMSRASRDGFKVWASIEPIIDFDSSYQMIADALAAGCQHFKIGLLTNNTKPCREKYDIEECIYFINRAMALTKDRATVYWKQSVREFVRTCRKPALTDDELHTIFDTWPHSVDSHWLMFE